MKKVKDLWDGWKKGFANQLFIRDNVEMRTERAAEVVCGQCRKRVFYLRTNDGGVGVENLIPFPGYPQPTDHLCPLCQKDVRVFLNGQPGLKTNKGYVK